MLSKLFSSIALAAFLLPLPSLAKQCGTASYYGPGFHGRPTASGERFNSQALTTAHRSLPFGTRLRVVNPVNGKSVLATITDRGPFVHGRELDLSYAAFAAIAPPSRGVTKVCYNIA